MIIDPAAMSALGQQQPLDSLSPGRLLPARSGRSLQQKPRHDGGAYDYRHNYFDLVVIVVFVILLMIVIIIVKFELGMHGGMIRRPQAGCGLIFWLRIKYFGLNLVGR